MRHLLWQKAKWESEHVKRPANAYMLFIRDFMANHHADYSNANAAVSAGKWATEVPRPTKRPDHS